MSTVAPSEPTDGVVPPSAHETKPGGPDDGDGQTEARHDVLQPGAGQLQFASRSESPRRSQDLDISALAILSRNSESASRDLVSSSPAESVQAASSRSEPTGRKFLFSKYFKRKIKTTLPSSSSAKSSSSVKAGKAQIRFETFRTTCSSCTASSNVSLSNQTLDDESIKTDARSDSEGCLAETQTGPLPEGPLPLSSDSNDGCLGRPLRWPFLKNRIRANSTANALPVSTLITRRKGRSKSLMNPEKESQSDDLETLCLPEVKTDETPLNYANRIIDLNGRAYVAQALSLYSFEFQKQALQAFLCTLDMTRLPLDMALRKFLLEHHITGETQQISRILESFAHQYYLCNSGHWKTEDDCYYVTYALLMLQTDAFNASIRKKMTKSMFAKLLDNTGLPEIVLRYYYDNVTYCRFKYIGSAIGSGRSSLSESYSDRIDPATYILEHRIDELKVEFTGFFDTEVAPKPAEELDDGTKIAIKYYANASTMTLCVKSASANFEPTQKILRFGLVSRRGTGLTVRSYRDCWILLTSKCLFVFRNIGWGHLLQLHMQQSNNTEINKLFDTQILDPVNVYPTNNLSATTIGENYVRLSANGCTLETFSVAGRKDCLDWVEWINLAEIMQLRTWTDNTSRSLGEMEEKRNQIKLDKAQEEQQIGHYEKEADLLKILTPLHPRTRQEILTRAAYLSSKITRLQQNISRLVWYSQVMAYIDSPTFVDEMGTLDTPV